MGRDATEEPAPNRAPTPGTSSKTASPGYPSGSRERPGSPGYQSDSEEPATFSEVPEPPPDDDGRIDPGKAYAEIAAQERKRRDPGIWLPGEDELDQDTGMREDRETRFSGDSYGGRGNPQVSVRLRPSDFERLRQLRRSGEFIRDRESF